MKRENGITLIALIITIIILVILAAVSIRAAYNSGIIDYSINGTKKYQEEANKEESKIKDVQGIMESVIKRLDKSEYGKFVLDYKIEFYNGISLAITPKIIGMDTYEEYAEYILETTKKSDADIFMEGDIYWNSDDADYTLEQIIRFWDPDATSLQQLADSNGMTIHEFLISEELVEPWGYLGDAEVHIECEESGEYQEIYIGDSGYFMFDVFGTTTFTGELENGQTTSVTINFNCGPWPSEGWIFAWTYDGEDWSNPYSSVDGLVEDYFGSDLASQHNIQSIEEVNNATLRAFLFEVGGSLGGYALVIDGIGAVEVPSVNINSYAPWHGAFWTSSGLEYSDDFIESFLDSLRFVCVGNGVTRIGDYAFRNMQSPWEFFIPGTVTSIGDGAFMYNWDSMFYFEGGVDGLLSSTSVSNIAFFGDWDWFEWLVNDEGKGDFRTEGMVVLWEYYIDNELVSLTAGPDY